MEAGISKNQILSELSRSPHGKLNEYIATGQKAAKEEAEFLAHLIAWDSKKGQVRDAKIGLPIVSLSVPSFPHELAVNSMAHLGMLSPIELLRGYRFALEMKFKAKLMRHIMNPLATMYLRNMEKKSWGEWQRIAVQHRHTLKELYALTHIKPGSDKVNGILFGRTLDKKEFELPKASIFYKVAHLGEMSAKEAAGTILENRIPFLIAMGALGKKAKDSDLVLALIKNMSATELVTNTKLLERLGMKENAALRGAFEEGLKKASTSTKNVLKTTRAAEAMDNETLKSNLRGLQDKQLASMAVEGNWLVLADKSGSMSRAITIAREVSGTLAKMVKGKVWLVFFDTMPQTIDVTGLPLDMITKATAHIKANGETSIGCGLQRMLDSKEEIDGIAIVSDAGENATPYFPSVYQKYCAWSGKEVPVYLYLCDGDNSGALVSNMRSAGHDMQVFDMNKQADYYSLPNLVSTMRTNRYSLIDEIMGTKLLTLEDVFKNGVNLVKEELHAAAV